MRHPHANATEDGEGVPRSREGLAALCVSDGNGVELTQLLDGDLAEGRGPTEPAAEKSRSTRRIRSRQGAA
eukprot:10824228-Lingulodinium_polyedra.AAC.1